MLNKTWRSSNSKKAWTQIQEKDIPLNIRVNDKNCEQKVTQLWILYLFTHQPWSLWVSFLVLYGSTNGKEPTCQCRRLRHRFSPWVGKIPWRRAWKPTLEYALICLLTLLFGSASTSHSSLLASRGSIFYLDVWHSSHQVYFSQAPNSIFPKFLFQF